MFSRVAPAITLSKFLFFVALTLAAIATPVRAQEPTDTAHKESKKNPRQEGLSLEPARKLQFTTTEGSWISVDVSPDGRTIVFDLLGDLYTMPFEGGVASPLTR